MPSTTGWLMTLVGFIGLVGVAVIWSIGIVVGVTFGDLLLVEIIWLQLVVILVQTILSLKQQNTIEAQYYPVIVADLRGKLVEVNNGTANLAHDIETTNAIDADGKPIEVGGEELKNIGIDFLGDPNHPRSPVCEFSDAFIEHVAERRPTIEVTYSDQRMNKWYAYIYVAKQGECQVNMTKRRRRSDP